MAKRALPHVEAAEQYARDVVAGDIVACAWVRQACERHFVDKARKDDLVWRPEEGERVCKFIEALPHVKGKWARDREPIRLRPWQCFCIVSIFSWYLPSGRRRFREAYIEVPRKNGKSVIGAGVGLYMFAADREFGAEVYSGATTEKQAWEVFRPAKTMAERTPALLSARGIEVCAKSIIIPGDGSRFEPLIGNPGDGASPSCAVIDEFHEHPTSALYDTMITGMGARENPLALIITTAGVNMAGPCHDKHLEVRKMLDGTIPNDGLFGVIYSIDMPTAEGAPGDDWADPAALEKANPNFGVSVDREFLLARQREAVLQPQHQNRFLTKHLNVWCSASVAWMSMPAWALCADPDLSIDEFAGEDCWIALDLASKLDIAANIQLFRKQLGDQTHYYVFGRYYLPEDTIAQSKNTSYRKWVNAGLLTVTDGAEIDFDVIGDDVTAISKRVNVREIAYDPWRATHLAHQLSKDGAVCVEMSGAKHATLSQAMDEVMAAVKAGRFHHDGNEILTWMVSNVVRKERSGIGIPVKEKPEQKIDGAIALLMAISRAMVAPEQEQTHGFMLL
jgi:phage terminase large subunit-like protein